MRGVVHILDDGGGQELPAAEVGTIWFGRMLRRRVRELYAG
jgi:hypothetical protein